MMDLSSYRIGHYPDLLRAHIGEMVCAGYDWIDGVRDVESGPLETSKANALAALSRAYVAVYEAGLIEFRIRNIEASIEAKARSTDNGTVSVVRAAILKRLDALEASLGQKAQPITLIDVDTFDPADRDAFLDGDDSVLTRYGFEPSPSYISAIVISVHPEHRDDWDEISDLDDEELERVERQHEREDRRRQAEDAERRQLEAIEAGREDLPTAPGNAYSPVHDRGDRSLRVVGSPLPM